MARKRTPDGRRVTLCLKLSEAEAAAVDAARGTLTRSEYGRRSVLAALEPAEPARPARKRQAATVRPAPAVAAEVAPASDDRRCNHSGVRILGGWCAQCQHRVKPDSGGRWE